jgi:hypothetical protein
MLVFPIYKNPEKDAFCYNKIAKMAGKGRAAGGAGFFENFFPKLTIY